VFLKKIVIENIRSIQKLEIPFTTDEDEIRKWTLILGENGTGKSTILKCIALVLAGSGALPELIGDVDSWIRYGTKKGEIKAELITAQGEIRNISIVLRKRQNIRSLFSENRESLDSLDQALEHTERNYFVVGYGASRRSVFTSSKGFNPKETFHNPRSQSVGTLFSSDAELQPFETWALDLHYRKGTKGLNIIKNTFGDFLPDATFKKIDRKAKKLIFETSDGTIPLSQLSDGYQQTVAWCGDLLYRITNIFDDYREPLNTRGLLLIDELDLHLHPLWQRKLIDFLTKKLPNFQKVVTTHSPFTAHQANEGELFSIKRKPRKGIELSQFEGSPRNLLLHQLVMTPVFGLETMDSKNIEDKKNEYKKLKKKKKKTSSEKKRLTELKNLLSDQPVWGEDQTIYKDIQNQLEILQEKVKKS